MLLLYSGILLQVGGGSPTSAPAHAGSCAGAHVTGRYAGVLVPALTAQPLAADQVGAVENQFGCGVSSLLRQSQRCGQRQTTVPDLPRLRLDLIEVTSEGI